MTSPGGLVASSVRSSAVWPVLVGVAVLAGATAAGIGALSLADALTATGPAEPRPGHHLRPAVRAGGGRDRRGGGGRLVPVRGVSGAAAGQRCSRRRRIPRAAARHRRVGGLDGVRGAARAADGVGRLRAAAARTPQSGQHLVGRQPRRDRGRVALDGVPRRGGDPRQPSGAALVVDADAAGRCADHAGCRSV